MNRMHLGAAIATVALAATAANAGMSYTGGGGLLNEDTPVLVSDIVVPDSFAITDVTVTLDNLTHSWMGDLVATIEHVESGTAVTLFQNIGGGAFGDSTDFGGTYGFNDAFTGDIWAEAAALDGDGVLPSGEYFASDETGAQTFLSAFNGIDSAGTWRLTIEDTFPTLDDGELGAWSVTIVPAPGAMALLGLAGLAGARRRRG